MGFSLTPFLVVWALLALVVFYFIVRRKMVASHEDDALHVLDGANTQQVAVNTELEKIDKWGKLLTIVAVVFGVLLGAAYLYQGWIQTSKTGV